MSIDYAHTAAGLMVIATLEGEMKVNLGDWVIGACRGSSTHASPTPQGASAHE